MKTRTKAEHIALLEETANFYNLSNRSSTPSGGCEYINESTGNMCAVGRCLINPKTKENVGFF